MGVNIEELQKQFSVENLNPYGACVVVPRNAFQHHWEKDLEAQGHRVFSNVYEGQQAFFIRLLKGKPKVTSQALAQTQPVSKDAAILRNLSEHEGKFLRIPLALLESSPNAPREVFEDIASLAQTIKEHGLLEPLLVMTSKNKNSYEVLAGERRLRACKKIGLETVPCILFDGLSLEQIKEMQLVENLQRKDLKPFEEIGLVRQLADKSLGQSEISFATGLSHGTIDHYLKISRILPMEIQRQIVKGGSHDSKDLSLTKAVMLAESKAEPAFIAETVGLIRKEGLKPKALAKKLAQEGSTKLHRAREARVFWKELTRTLKNYAAYWSDYATLTEHEEPDSYHLELHVRLPKDLKD